MLQQSLEAVVIPQNLSVKQRKEPDDCITPNQWTGTPLLVLVGLYLLIFLDTNLPVVFSCGNKTGDITENPTTTLDDGQRVGLASIR